MKTSKILFFSTITLFGVMFAVFTVMAEANVPPTSTPSLEVADTPGPVINADLTVSPAQVDQNGDVTFAVGVEDISGIKSVTMKLVNSSGNIVGQTYMNDDGMNGDDTAKDGIYSKTWNIGSQSSGIYDIDIVMTDRLNNSSIVSYDSILTVTAGGDISCNSGADCTVDEVCCNQACVSNECVDDTGCVRCTEWDPVTGVCINTESGTCDTAGCQNVCVYIPTPTCTLDSDCGSIPFDPLDACCSGICLTSECAVDTDCINQPGGTCNTTLCPNACEYSSDTVPPVVTILDPFDGQIFTTDTIIIKASAADASGIDRVEFGVDGSTPPYIQYFDQSAYGNPDEYWQTITFTNGIHTVIATAYDMFGNVNIATINIEFVLSGSGPIIDAFTTDKTNYTAKEAMQVSVSAHDNDSNISLVEIYSSKGGGTLFQQAVAQPIIKLSAGIGAGSVVDWGGAFDKYAVRQDNFKLPFIKIADAQIQSPCGVNCICTDEKFSRFIYTMVSDGTNPATQSNNIDLVITVTTEVCK